MTDTIFQTEKNVRKNSKKRKPANQRAQRLQIKLLEPKYAEEDKRLRTMQIILTLLRRNYGNVIEALIKNLTS